MDKKLSRFVLLISLLLFMTDNADCLMIDSQNVQSMAIYGRASGFGIGLQPNQIAFNVTDASLIASLISSRLANGQMSETMSLPRTDVYLRKRLSSRSTMPESSGDLLNRPTSCRTCLTDGMTEP